MTLASLLVEHPFADGDALLHTEERSITAGEARAAELLAEMFRARGLQPTLEQESAASGFWPSTGLAAATGALAGLIGGRARIAAAALATAAAALMADDVENNAHLLRRVLPRRPARTA